MKIKRLYRAVTSLTVEYPQTCEFAHLFKADLKKNILAGSRQWKNVL